MRPTILRFLLRIIHPSRSFLFTRLHGTISAYSTVRFATQPGDIPFPLRGRRATSILTTKEKPRQFPTSGFTTIDADQCMEEEQILDYSADWFYPVHLGDVLHDRYQVVTKLGWGACSTIWLARDLQDRRFVALKVYVHNSMVQRELPAYHHLAGRITNSSHEGRGNIHQLISTFELDGPDGRHPVLVFDAAQMSLHYMKLVCRPDGFDEDFVKGAMIELLKALDFLHTEGEIIHTDIHSSNLLLGAYTDSIFQRLADEELANPVERKPVSPSRTIYMSRLMRPKEGPMLLSDFGEARIGPGPHAGDIMPLEYRAPETLLYVGWSYPVDIWSVGLTAWDLLEPKRLFTARDEDGDLYDAAHLAEMIATLGPPPPEFLAKNPERRADFWDDQGKWLGLAPIPENRTMEELETRLEDKKGFLAFIRRALTWLPEERPTAKELLQDPRLRGQKA